MTWIESEYSCSQKNNSHLVEIYTQFQQDFITMMALFLEEHDPNGFSNWWIGLSDAGREGRWYWTNSLKPSNFTNWYSGQPDGGINRNYAYVYTFYDGKWYAASETYNSASPLCQFFI